MDVACRLPGLKKIFLLNVRLNISTGHADVEEEQLYNQTVHHTLNISENQRMTINWLLFLGNKTSIYKQQWNMKKLKRK